MKKSKKNKAPLLKVGMRVCGRWNDPGPNKGRWFDGTVQKVFPDTKTIHMLFDDGDMDDALSWDHVSVLEDG